MGLLKAGGIDVTASTELGEAFGDIGGIDRRLGRESLVISDGTYVTVSSLSIETKDAADEAYEALTLLSKYIGIDLNGINKISEELFGAQNFALSASDVFSDGAQGVYDVGNAEALASLVVSEIMQKTGSLALAAHSDLDTMLAKELLLED